MNVEMIRQQYGVTQIKLPAMTGREFKYFIESLDFARYNPLATVEDGAND